MNLKKKTTVEKISESDRYFGEWRRKNNKNL